MVPYTLLTPLCLCLSSTGTRVGEQRKNQEHAEGLGMLKVWEPSRCQNLAVQTQCITPRQEKLHSNTETK